MVGNMTTTQPGGATCPDKNNDGLVAGIVICVLLLVVLGVILMVILAKHRGWIDTNRFNFKIPEFGRTGQNSRPNDDELSTYQEGKPTKTSKTKTTGNRSYDVCIPIKAGTGAGSVTANNGNDTAGQRTSVSGKSYLELIVEPSNSPSYENVSIPKMRNKIDGDNEVNISDEQGSDVYINFGIDIDERNEGKLPEPEVEESDLYTNVGISGGDISIHGNRDSNQLVCEEEDNYFVLEKENSDQIEMHLSNPENECDISENYFVLEPQNGGKNAQ